MTPFPEPITPADREKLEELAKPLSGGWVWHGNGYGSDPVARYRPDGDDPIKFRDFVRPLLPALIATSREAASLEARVVELEAALKAAEEWRAAAEAELRRTDPNYTPLLDKYVADIQAYSDRAEAPDARATALLEAAEAALAFLRWTDATDTHREVVARHLKAALGITEDEPVNLLRLLQNVIAAWEALGEGDWPPSLIENWLRTSMWPAINSARAALTEHGAPNDQT